MNRRPKAFMLTCLFVLASLAGCFGEEKEDVIDPSESFQVGFVNPEDAVIRTGEFNDFTLEGKGNSITTEPNVLIFINGTYVKGHTVTVEDNTIFGQFLTTPLTTHVNITFTDDRGISQILEISVTDGVPIVNGEEWFEKTDFITSVCSDTTKCGGYVNRWMGAGNGFYERAAEYFKGHFEGLGYETHLLRVTDHGNLAQPESLNVIAWKEGTNDSCVQGMGGHMDIAPPGGPPGGGTYEGAYDNTAGTVAMMLYARAFVDLNFECDTFLALWSSEEEGLRGSNAFANNQCDYCLPHDKELKFYINMDMMGMSWPAHKNGNGDPFPYHAWSGPDLDPDVQDVEITSVLEFVHRDVMKAPMDLRIDGTYGAGCDQHWEEHEDLVFDVHEDTFGRSDHVTFRNLGAQTIFHLGAYDEDYSAYHSPSDTLDNMIQEVGGQEELEKSMEFVMWAAMLELIIADKTPEIRNLNV
tara:strand:+ start:115 stop:1521 length:1407 start_codon:yes stop_codon:yes gene_type:complete